MLVGNRSIENHAIRAHLCGSALYGSPCQLGAWKKNPMCGLRKSLTDRYREILDDLHERVLAAHR